MLTANVGSTDRIIRLIAGLAVGGAGLYFSSWWGLIGLVLIGTAFLRFCPAYVPLEMSTCCNGSKCDDAGPEAK